MVLEHIICVGQTLFIINKSFFQQQYCCAQVLQKNVIPGQQAEEALEVLGVTTAMGTMRSRIWAADREVLEPSCHMASGTLRLITASHEGHRHTDHVGQFQNDKSGFVFRPCNGIGNVLLHLHYFMHLTILIC